MNGPAHPLGIAAGDPHAGLALIRPLVRLVMQYLPLCREFVLRPHLFQMDQAALARAMQPMLERGKRQEVVFVKHLLSFPNACPHR
jgi:hypothetical protein